MGEAQELQLSIMAQEANEASSPGHTNVPDRSLLPRHKSFNWWLKVAIYAFLVIAGQSTATLLGRLYFDKGGDSKWLATVEQLCGFPVLLPYYCIPAASRNPITKIVLSNSNNRLAYLPVSTYSLICASQLAFNALFSFLLNSQKFTPYIVNSLVLLTISSTLLVFQGDSADDPSGGSKTKYAIGFICTVGASAGYGLVLSLTQLAFKRVIRKETFRVVMDMIVYQSLVATCVILVGLFASGEWKGLKKEMGMYKLGTVSYVMNLVWTAIIWQLFSIGSLGLIFEASSLFSNAISAMGLPVVPILAVIFFHDKMDGIKAMAMVLAIWGFISYAYQHYLDDRKSKNENKNVNGEVPEASSLEKING
ncbi:unnamed protein product [Prunus armeniaca]|uniref:Probable purine permease n=1 Tax=Prunus armeniaca TaxID=36596 RepID=A0A6J5WYA1_PRUAR|nr:unnamed protein product [Prunus armeniaca]